MQNKPMGFIKRLFPAIVFLFIFLFSGCEQKPEVGARILTAQFRQYGGNNYTVFVYDSGHLGFTRGKLNIDRSMEEIEEMENGMTVFRISLDAYEGLLEQIPDLPQSRSYLYSVIYTKDSPYIVMEAGEQFAAFLYGEADDKWNGITQTLCGILSECGLPKTEKDYFGRLSETIPDPKTFSELLTLPDETVLAYVFLEIQGIGGVEDRIRFTFYNDGTVCVEEGKRLYLLPHPMDDGLKKDVYPVDGNRLDDLKNHISTLMKWYDGESTDTGFIKDFNGASDCPCVTVCTEHGATRMYITPPHESAEVEFFKAAMTILEICEDIPEENDAGYERWFARFSEQDLRDWDLFHVAD